jgi:HK97 family phage portal protein
MSVKNKAGSLSLKAIYFSIRDALAYRQLDRDPGNRDVTRGDYNSGGGGSDGTPKIDRALQLSTIWACVRLISGTISTLPLFMYERTVTNGRDTRKVARDHPLYYLLHDSPNADMTAVEFWESVMVGLLTWGNAYVLKTYSGSRIVSLDPLNPALMTVQRTLDGDVTYIYADPRGRKEYTEAKIWHVKGFGSDGLIGLSPIGMGWRSIYSATNVENAASNTFGGNMRPSGVVSIEPILKPDQRTQMQEVIKNGVFGDSRMGMVHLLEGGAKYTQLSLNPIDAQMAEHLTRSVEDLCRWFQMPPSMIGHGGMVSNWGTGREQINLSFKQYVLDQYTSRIEQSINKHLLTPAERRRFYAEFNFESLLRTDSAGRAALYKSALFDGWMNVDEVRELENRGPVPGGDVYRVQAAMIPLTQLGTATNPAPNATIGQENEGIDDEP